MMAFILYIIALPFLYLIALLPFPVLYVISDCLYFWVYVVVGYRKKVVRKNLKNSFPGLSDDALKTIEKKFYAFFCDIIVETIKTLTITRKQAIKRFHLNNVELIEKFYKKNQNIIIVLGHYGNWELAGAAINVLSNYQFYVIYKPLSNKYFNQLIFKMRSRLGNKLIPMKKTQKMMSQIDKESQPAAIVFIADQTPAPDNAYWTVFLNQDTPVFWGTELLAKRYNYPVVYSSVNRTKRGYYTINFELIEENPRNTLKGEISEKHTKKLEKDIVNHPEFWLWTHRRWKHKKNI